MNNIFKAGLLSLALSTFAFAAEPLQIDAQGNSHFLMGEKNNAELVKLADQWLSEKGLK